MTIGHPKVRKNALAMVADSDLLALRAHRAKQRRAALAEVFASQKKFHAAKRDVRSIDRELVRRGLIQRGAK
jgi:hypothetical protein